MAAGRRRGETAKWGGGGAMYETPKRLSTLLIRETGLI